MRGGLPCRRELLSRESFDASVMEDAGQGSGKPEAIRQHVLIAGHAEIAAEVVVPVEDLTNDGFCVRRIYVALFH